MKLNKNINLILAFLVCCIFFAPSAGFTQGTGWKMNKTGYWIKINEGLGISYGGVQNEDIIAAGPNSIVTMRSSKAGNAPYHQAEGEPFFTILKSTDKGDTWQTLYKDTNDWVSGYDIGHPTKNVTGWLMRKGYSGGPQRVFMFTTNGGKTIQSLEHQAVGGMIKGDEAINVSMYDAKHWAFTTHDDFSLKDHTYVYITHDGGKTWKEKHIKVDKSKLGIYQVVMRSPKKLTLFPKPGGDAKTRISTDGGKTWQIHDKLPDNITFGAGFEFPTANIGYAGGIVNGNQDNKITNDTGFVYKTTDGGRSWEKVLEKQYPNLAFNMGALDVDCISKNECITGGTTPNIIRTNNAGKNWLIDSVAFSTKVMGPDFVYTAKDNKQLALALPHGRGELFKFKLTDTTTTTGKAKISPQEQALAIYPNPSDDRLQIRWQGKNPVTGKLYNMQGQVVHHFNLTPGQQETYSLSGIKPGTYVFKVNGRDITKKVLIQGQAD